eukprot:Mycagemm_TRINITY_DN10381_c2_g1::TRINITY_DN10381_c2_g1_i1::g.1153::m.1153 type:complete len:129 gc:universal TRINITY_DN10381_c2_g1_i1:1174-1560(+)
MPLAASSSTARSPSLSLCLASGSSAAWSSPRTCSTATTARSTPGSSSTPRTLPPRLRSRSTGPGRVTLAARASPIRARLSSNGITSLHILRGRLPAVPPLLAWSMRFRASSKDDSSFAKKKKQTLIHI